MLLKAQKWVLRSKVNPEGMSGANANVGFWRLFPSLPADVP